jgi:methionine-rich copper-binding protein CopC
MPGLTIMCGLILLLWAIPAGAHVRLQSADPADGSVINVAPARIELTFSQPMRLTAAWIKQADESCHDLRPLPAERAQHFAIALPPLLPGRYSVGWRGFGADGHVAAGEIQFTLSADLALDLGHASGSFGRRYRSGPFNFTET